MSGCRAGRSVGVADKAEEFSGKRRLVLFFLQPCYLLDRKAGNLGNLCL